MSILSWIFGQSKQNRDFSSGINGGQNWFPSPNVSGTIVTPESAMTLPTVYACVDVIASSIASMPFVVYRRDGKGGRQPDPDHPVYDLVHDEPNPEIGANSFWTNLVAQAVLHGNGYAEIVRDQFDGSPIALHLLDTKTTQVKRDSKGFLYYETYCLDHQSTRHLPENILHFAKLSVNGNGIVGDSPIMLARDLIGCALAAHRAAAAVFGNGSLPLGYFTTPDEIDEMGRKTLREYWNRVHQGPYNAGKVAILEQGVEFNPISVDIESLQYNETQRQHAKAIAQLFGVPPHKVGILDDATYSNIEEQDLDFYKSTLRLWCERVESEVNRKLFTKEERKVWYAEHNMDVVIRGNRASQDDHLVKTFGIGGYSVNEVLQSIGHNPIGEAGEGRYLLNNFTRLDAEPSPNPETLPEVSETQDDPPVSDTTLRAVKTLLASEVDRMLRREDQALKRFAKRNATDIERDQFRARHRKVVVEVLTPHVEAYRALREDFDGGRLVEAVANGDRESIKGLMR